MRFINKGEAVQVREQEGPNRYKWTLLKTGETIELPEGVGKAYGFEKFTEPEVVDDAVKATEGNIGKTKVETKQINSKNKLNKKRKKNG